MKKVMVRGFKRLIATGAIGGLSTGAMLFIPGMFFVSYGLSYFWGILVGIVLCLGMFMSWGLAPEK